MKRCGRCKQELLVEQFYHDASRNDGYNPVCKACKSAYSSAYYAKNRAKHAPYERERYQARAAARGRTVTRRPPQVQIPDGMKHCLRCHTTKPIGEFDRDYHRKDGHRSHCRDCRSAAARAQYGRRKARQRRTYDTLRRMGMSRERYDAMLEAQGGVCAICGSAQTTRGWKRLAVDHNHETGEILGLLCDDCNQGLGYFGDKPEILARAITYLTTTRDNTEQQPD